MTCTRTRRGFTLLTMLIALTLLGAFAIIAGRLTRATFRVMYDAGEACTRLTRLNSALSRLEADVWGAREVSATGATATVSTTDGITIAWTSGNDGVLVRTGGEGESDIQRWPEMGPMSFEWDGIGLTLRDAKPTAGRGAWTRFVSQQRLAEGNR